MYNISKNITTFLISCALLGGACDSELAQEDARSSAPVHRANLSLAGGSVADSPWTRFDELGELDIAGEANVAVDDLQISAIEEAVHVSASRVISLPTASAVSRSRALRASPSCSSAVRAAARASAAACRASRSAATSVSAWRRALRSAASSSSTYRRAVVAAVRSTSAVFRAASSSSHRLSAAASRSRHMHAVQHRDEHGLRAALDVGDDPPGRRRGRGAGVARSGDRDQPGLLLLVS